VSLLTGIIRTTPMRSSRFGQIIDHEICFLIEEIEEEVVRLLKKNHP